MDGPAIQRVDAGLKRALITYGTARVVHGFVSVAQGTQIDIAPAGMGTTLTPGQILAPAAEMLKQFSDLMLLVCVSFAIQKLMITVGGFSAISLALTVIAIGWTLQFMRHRLPPAWLTKMFIVLLFVRFAIPLTVLGSDALFQTFMANEYNVSQEMISSMASETDTQTLPMSKSIAKPGLLGKLKSWIGQKTTEAVDHYHDLKSVLEHGAENVVKLMAIFVLQTMVIPILMLWGLYGLAKVALQLPLSRLKNIAM